MARVNINILGISELKWTGMGEFNSHDHYIYYCGQEIGRASCGKECYVWGGVLVLKSLVGHHRTVQLNFIQR